MLFYYGRSWGNLAQQRRLGRKITVEVCSTKVGLSAGGWIWHTWQTVWYSHLPLLCKRGLPVGPALACSWKRHWKRVVTTTYSVANFRLLQVILPSGDASCSVIQEPGKFPLDVIKMVAEVGTGRTCTAGPPPYHVENGHSDWMFHDCQGTTAEISRCIADISTGNVGIELPRCWMAVMKDAASGKGLQLPVEQLAVTAHDDWNGYISGECCSL